MESLCFSERIRVDLANELHASCMTGDAARKYNIYFHIKVCVSRVIYVGYQPQKVYSGHDYGRTMDDKYG